MSAFASLPILALRNLARNRRRTALSLAVVAFGVVALLLTAGFVRFSFDGLREAIVRGGLGHLEIVNPAALGSGASQERNVENGLDGWEAIRAEIEKAPHVLAAEGNVHLMGLVQKGERSASFLGLGVEPAREKKMRFETKLKGGQALPDEPPADGEDRVLLGLGLAESVGAKPGDVVTVLAMGEGGSLDALDMTVAGVITSGVADLDTRLLRMHLVSAQRVLRTDRVSDLVVALDETPNTAAVRDDLKTRLGGHGPLAIVEWRSRAPFYDQVRNLYDGIFRFLGSIVVVLVILATSNTLLMSVMERVREIGILRAIGTSRGQVAAIVLFEAFWLAVIGTALGDLLGAAAIWAVNAAKLQMPPPPGAVNPLDLALAYVPEAFWSAFVLMGIVLAVAAIVPTIKAVRLRPIEALTWV